MTTHTKALQDQGHEYSHSFWHFISTVSLEGVSDVNPCSFLYLPNLQLSTLIKVILALAFFNSTIDIHSVTDVMLVDNLM